jgi:hypothetical protein
MGRTLLKGICLSILLYVMVTGVLIGLIKLIGGDIYQIPGYVFWIIGMITGISSAIITEKLNW